MPFTADGRDRLTAELERADEVVDPPELVWLFHRDQLREIRGTLHGWRDGAPRRGLVVWYLYPMRDCVEWICEPFVRQRNE